MIFKRLHNIMVLANEMNADITGPVHFDLDSMLVTLPLDEATLSDAEINDFAVLGVHPTQEGLMSFFI